MEVKLLLAAITALAGVIAYLFRWGRELSKETRAMDASMIKERESWNVERATTTANHQRELDQAHADFELQEVEMRADFEKRAREMLERHDEARRRESEIFRNHEDQARKEFASIMERVAEEASKSSSVVAQLMQKMFDKFTGPRR